MKSILLIVFFVVYNLTAAFSQYNAGGTQFYIGPVAGINMVRYVPGKNISTVPSAYKNRLGYTAGVLYKFKVKENISLHGEFNFSRKIRSVDDSIKITAFRNYHIDAPILLELSFPAKNKYIGNFQYYFNIGPQISYWLKGTGETTFKGDSSQSVSYAINFKEGEQTILSKEQVNRFQYGINVGAGLTLPSIGDNFFVVDLRYAYCQTYLGDRYTVNVDGSMLTDDLRGNYHVLSLSLAYTFGINFLPNSQKNSGMKVKTVVK